MKRCRCKPYGKSVGMCRLECPRFLPGDLVEQRWPDGTWRGPFDVVREWRRKGWGREHMVLLCMWTMCGSRVGGSAEASQVRPLKATTPWGLPRNDQRATSAPAAGEGSP